MQCSILDQIYDSYCSLKKWSKLKPKKIFLAHSKTFLKYGICVCQVKKFSLSFPLEALRYVKEISNFPLPSTWVQASPKCGSNELNVVQIK